MATNDTCCTIVPYFKVFDGKLDAFRALCERFVETTSNEPGCLYYGFSFDQHEVHCREGYKDADAALAHIENVGSLLKELEELALTVRFEIHGPEEELNKLRIPLTDLNPRYYKIEYGFRR